MRSTTPDMNEKKTGLENFVDRHRADFDAFEPRPDLWDDIEQELAAPTAGAATTLEPEETAAPLRIVKLHPTTEVPSPTTTTTTTRSGWLPRPGIAAALALLVMAGFGAVWSSGHRTAGWSSTAPLVVAPNTIDASETDPFDFGASTVAATAEAPVQRLTQEVHRMEAYYATQIQERQTELEQLEAQMSGASTPADWQRELASLDSTYRQLKVELYRNPEPAVVLDAMNRNLQIRLDILNQQTRTRAQMQDYRTQPLMIADNHPMP